MSNLNDLREKFKRLLQLLQIGLREYGYIKKGQVFIRCVNGLNHKLDFQFEKIRNRDIGSLRLYVSLEYPEIDNLKSELFCGEYSYKTNIFQQDLNFLQGENVFRSFNFNLETNEQLLSELIMYCIINNVLPLYQDYYSTTLDILKAFEDDRPEIRYHLSSNQGNDEYYLTWALIALCNNYIEEANSILSLFNSFCKDERKKSIVAEYFSKYAYLKKQNQSVYLELSTKHIYIRPSIDLIKKQILQFDGIRLYFMILHNTISKDYLQVIGGPAEFALEVRLYINDEYKHYRAERFVDSNEEKKVLFGVDLMQIPLKQILDFKQVIEIIETYNNNGVLNSNYNWLDISSYFG